MIKSIAKGLFYFVALVAFVWTSTLTYSFMVNVLPNAHFLIPVASLVVFDVGMVAWMFVFLHYSEGSMQRAVSIMTCVFDFVGVGIMAVAEIFLGGQTLVLPPENIGEYAVWAVALWTVVNVGAVLAFHLSAPEARRAMAMQAEMDAITDGAFEHLKQLRTQHSQRLANTIGDRMFTEIEATLTADRNGDGVPDLMQSPRTHPNPTPITITATHQQQPPQRMAMTPPNHDIPDIVERDEVFTTRQRFQ